MRDTCNCAIGSALGFATLSLVALLLLLLASLSLLTSALLHAELQIGQGELVLRQAEMDAEARLGMALATLGEQADEPAPGVSLAAGVSWRRLPSPGGKPRVLELTARGEAADGQASALIRQQVSWVPVMNRVPSLAVLTPNLSEEQIARLSALDHPSVGLPGGGTPSLAAIQQELDELFVEQGEVGARIRWLEDQAGRRLLGCSELRSESRGLILVVGSCEPPSSIGSAEHPVILLVRDGGLFLASELTIHGVVILYRQTAEPEPLSTVQLAAGSQIIGALVSQHSLSDPSVIERVIPAPERLLSMFESAPFRRLVRVRGSWQDW